MSLEAPTGTGANIGASAQTGATATMISLIGSLADNKGALGRRYGEWAVSAPTIESAVAAAAMAQDELGHARATYPVLAKLGVTREDDALHTGHPMPVLQSELPDWASVIAANLVIDGILTTFVSSARESSIEPLAQRARKILQEEGAHKVHAEAWAKRICAAGARDRQLLLERIHELWVQAARWPGPDEQPGYREAIARGMVSEGPAAIRNRVRQWMSERFAAQQMSLARLRSQSTGRAGTRTGVGEQNGLPVLRLRRHPADRPVGRADDHQPGCDARSCNSYFEVIREAPMDDPLRRRSVGAPAARSLLLTILGEYVLPRGEPVWQETLVAALTGLGYSEQAARQALSRSTREGWLTVERHGRRARMSLSEGTAELLRTGAARIYSFGERWDWDGRWLVLILRVPEERREIRHQIRARLAWAGLGSLGGGVWVTPHVEREPELATAIQEEPAADATSFVASLATLGSPQSVAMRRLGSRDPKHPLRRVHHGLREGATNHADGVLPDANAARARVAQVPLPGPRPARRAAAERLATNSAPMLCSPTVTAAGRGRRERTLKSSRPRARPGRHDEGAVPGGMTKSTGLRLKNGSIELLDLPGDADRPVIVLLHEGLGSVGLWREFPCQLQAGTHAPIIAYSRYGHGQSDPPPEPRTPNFMHDEALDVLPELLAGPGHRRARAGGPQRRRLDRADPCRPPSRPRRRGDRAARVCRRPRPDRDPSSPQRL